MRDLGLVIESGNSVAFDSAVHTYDKILHHGNMQFHKDTPEHKTLQRYRKKHRVAMVFYTMVFCAKKDRVAMVFSSFKKTEDVVVGSLG
jgi:hypothetical protein